MKLVGGRISPYVRKVRVAVIELGLGDKVERTSPTGAPGLLNSNAKEVNPIGKVPTFFLDNGERLHDSRMIMQYLNKMASGSLYPPDDWAVIRRESEAEGLLDASLLLRYETTYRPEALRWNDWIEGQSLKIHNLLDAMETEASALAQVDGAAIGTACGLGFLDFCFPDWGWRNGHPTLAAWYETFSQRESMVTTNPPVLPTA